MPRAPARAHDVQDTVRLRVTRPKSTAAGIPAAAASMRHHVTSGPLTAARSLLMVNQTEGFDCPGCAWPDPADHRTRFEFCENGAKAVADEVTRRRIRPAFFSKHSIQDLAERSDAWLNAQGRLTSPMILEAGSNHYQSIEWEAALDLITARLKASDAERSVFYTSGRTSNEAAFLYQLLVRMHGTNNLPDCSNMCHESSGRALVDSIGIGKGTVTLDDFNAADLIMVIGQNPGTNHPRMLTALRDAKRSGARIVSINPLKETGLVGFKHPQDYLKLDVRHDSIADLHVPVRIGGDAALLKGLMKVHLEAGGLDDGFIEGSTVGFPDLVEDLINTPWDRIVRASGIDRNTIEELGRWCASSTATIACWAMGLTQQPNGVEVIQDVANLLLMGGHIGRPGAGLCPVRGHSNVQGDRTMGIWERPSESFIEGMEHGTGLDLPRDHGFDVVESIQAMMDGNVDIFVSMGGNFLSAAPDTELTAKAIGNVGLTVQVSTKLNRSHLVTGQTALILPVLGRTEIDVQASGPQFVTVENSMSVVHRSTGRLKPASPHLRSEPWIVAELGHRLHGDGTIRWRHLVSDYDHIRDMIESCIEGFDSYNQRVRLPSGFTLPNKPRDERGFSTPDGLARFRVHPLDGSRIEADRFVLMTLRSHDQYNTTIYGLNDRYRGIHGHRRVVMMNPHEMVELGLKTGDEVDLTSHHRGTERFSPTWKVVPIDLPRGNLAAYFPEANVLVPLDSTASDSNTPTSKRIIVSVSRKGGPLLRSDD